MLTAFLRGLGRSMDIFGVSARYDVGEPLERTEAEALAGDWQRVGGYLSWAMAGRKLTVPRKSRVNAVVIDRGLGYAVRD